MERLSGAGKNERLSKAFSQALRRAPLLVPAVATGAALEAAINPPAVYAQQTPQKDCVISIQTENPNTGIKTTANLSSSCGEVARVQVDFPEASLIKTTSIPKQKEAVDRGTAFFINLLVGIGVGAAISLLGLNPLEIRERRVLEKRVNEIVRKYQQQKAEAETNQDVRKT